LIEKNISIHASHNPITTVRNVYTQYLENLK
jgi:hypothetical protein